LKFQFLLVYRKNKALGICAFCKAPRYQRTSHDCKVLKKYPGLEARDLTVEDSDWLNRDPYEYYWHNWEGAVKYGEILLRKNLDSSTAKKELRYFAESSPEQFQQQNEEPEETLQRKLFGECDTP